MAVSQKLELRQRLAPVITPKLRQAIKLLQLTNLELGAHVERELDRNPLLESVAPDAPDATEAADDADAAPEGLAEYDSGASHLPEDCADRAAAGGMEETDLPGWSEPAAASGDTLLEGRADRPADLASHLLNQMGLLFSQQTQLRIGGYLIEALDERGYLTVDIEEVARELNCTTEQVEAVLHRLQTCEPVGVFARSLAECLELQLSDKGLLDPPMQRLLDNLDLVAQGERDRLARACGIDQDQLRQMLGRLRGLDPKPGLSFTLAGEPVEPVSPDLILRSDGKGGWRVEMNSRTLPKVMVNRGYYDELLAMARRKKDREYLSERLQEAGWLVRAIAQRTATILRVGDAIVKHQEGFFHEGPSGLKPLTLREIAERVEMHESTISRVTGNKYLATPTGLLPLRYFFTSGLGGRGRIHAAEAVRHRIREIVGAEMPGKALSDDAIARRLRDEGVEIARRTVAKYREAMRIPPSPQRKRQHHTGA
jgi:RNA polymerase sigma-54 factor